MDGQRVQAVGDERFSVAFHFDLFGRDLFCVTDVSVSQRRAHWHRASDPRVAWGFCPGGGWAPSSAAPDGLDKPMLRGANRRAIVPIVLAVHPSGDCLNRPGCSPVGRLSQSSWLFTPSGDCLNRPGCSPVGRLSQSSWLFSRRAIVPIVLAVRLLPEACSPAVVSRSGASVGQQVSPERKFGWGLFKEAPLILGWFDSSERREGFCAV
jgi:hypothetical protein